MDELPTDAMPLIFCIDGEVCEIGNIGKVREGARDTYQALTVPSRNSKIGII